MGKPTLLLNVITDNVIINLRQLDRPRLIKSQITKIKFFSWVEDYWYCLLDVISLPQSQSDHIKPLPLYFVTH